MLSRDRYVDNRLTGSTGFGEPEGPAGPEPERFTFVLHDLAQPPTAEQLSQGALAPYVDGTYLSPSFAANPLLD